MSSFLIPPEYAQILKTFTQTPSLRAAARELKIDPAALTRKVQKISDEHGLIYKSAQKWIVTEKGNLFISWANDSASRLNDLMAEDTKIKISCYAWFAEQIIIRNLQNLMDMSPQRSWTIKTNSTELEKEIINNVSDFAITRYAPTDPAISHKKILTQPWVILIPQKWKKMNMKDVTTIKKELNGLPFIRMMHRNPEDILTFQPQTLSKIMVDGVIGIRTAVSLGQGWSCLPKASVSSPDLQKYFQIIELPGLEEDNICLWWLRSRKDLGPVTKDLTQWLNLCFKAKA